MILFLLFQMTDEGTLHGMIKRGEKGIYINYRLGGDELTNIVEIPIYLGRDTLPPINIARYGDLHMFMGYRGERMGMNFKGDGRFLSDVDTPYIHSETEMNLFASQLGYRNLEIFTTAGFIDERIMKFLDDGNMETTLMLRVGGGLGGYYSSDGGSLYYTFNIYYNIPDTLKKFYYRVMVELEENISFYFITPQYYNLSAGLSLTSDGLTPYISFRTPEFREGINLHTFISPEEAYMDGGFRFLKNMNISLKLGMLREERNIYYQSISFFYIFRGIGAPPYHIFTREEG